MRTSCTFQKYARRLQDNKKHTNTRLRHNSPHTSPLQVHGHASCTQGKYIEKAKTRHRKQIPKARNHADQNNCDLDHPGGNGRPGETLQHLAITRSSPIRSTKTKEQRAKNAPLEEQSASKPAATSMSYGIPNSKGKQAWHEKAADDHVDQRERGAKPNEIRKLVAAGTPYHGVGLVSDRGDER